METIPTKKKSKEDTSVLRMLYSRSFFFFLLYFQCECNRNSCQATTLAERCLVFSTFLCVVSRFFFFFFFVSSLLRFQLFVTAASTPHCLRFSHASLSLLFLFCGSFFFSPFLSTYLFPCMNGTFFFLNLWLSKKKKRPKTYACWKKKKKKQPFFFLAFFFFNFSECPLYRSCGFSFSLMHCRAYKGVHEVRRKKKLFFFFLICSAS